MTNLIISWDPGQTTGIAIGDDKGKLLQLKQVTFEDLPKYLDSVTAADLFIIEEFRIRTDKALSFSFSDMKVIQVIGMLLYRAHQLNAQVKFQKPLNKSIGYKWSGTVPPSNHNLTHQTDAYAHLVFYWVHSLNLPPPAQAKMRPIDSVQKKD